MSTIPGIEYAENSSQRLPCVVVLDGSSSMTQNNAIEELNDGLRLLEEDLKKDDTARLRVRILLIRVGAPNDVEIVTDWVDAIDFTAPRIQAQGLTPLGQGVRRALEEIEDEKRRLNAHKINYNRPWMFLFTDGEPTDDDWESAADECRNAESANKVVTFCIGVGDANLTKLARFSNRTPQKLKELPGEDGRAAFKQFFLWLSRSLRDGSKSAPSADTQLPARDDWAVAPGR